jgi:NAD-dependent dihydropyrimidine dehydrogenase PreA subunit
VSYVVTELCMNEKHTNCYDVCPVDAIKPSPNSADFCDYDQLFIDPARAIDCGACQAVRPVEAIYDDRTLPAHLTKWIYANEAHFIPAGRSA